VSWNTFALLQRCIASVRAQTHPSVQLVVVDNASRDGSAEWLRAQQDVELVENPRNVGFAAANNAGLRLCTGDFVLLVNADVELNRDYLELCVRHFDDAEVGSVTGKLFRFSPVGMLDSTGHEVYGVGWAANRGEELPDVGFDAPGEVFGVCAAAAVYRKAALDDVAIEGEVLDETYVSYIEDVDLDWRLRWRGWKAWYEPRAVAVHHRSASGARFSAPVMRHILANRILTVVKNYDRGTLLRNSLGFAAFTLVKTVDFATVHPSATLGLLDAARLIPVALRKRRWIRSNRRRRPGELSRWLLPFPWPERVRRRLLGPAAALRG